MSDWLSTDPRDSAAQEELRDRQRRADVERALLYKMVFESPAGARLLAAWDQEIANLRVAVNATLSDYVAAETVRNFVRKIHEQINLANTEGKQ
jgi:hypothetical protein